MSKKQTPEERKQRLLEQLARGRATSKKNREQIAILKEKGEYVPEEKKPRRPRNLDKIVRQILDDDSLVDKVIKNQPEYWADLPTKNGNYIIATVMMVKAMGGDIKAAEWIRKTGFGDKVQLETENGFFSKSEFKIQVIPSKTLESGIDPLDVSDNQIKQIEE